MLYIRFVTILIITLSVMISCKGGVSTGKTAPSFKVSSINSESGLITIKGSDLNTTKYVRAKTDSRSYDLTIVSVSANQVQAKLKESAVLAFNGAVNLIIGGAYGEVAVDAVFSVADNSITLAKLTGTLAGNGVGLNQSLKWDGTSWVPFTLTSSVAAQNFISNYNSFSNTPNIFLTSPVTGDYYIINVGGDQNLNGTGIVTYTAGDQIYYNGSAWVRIPNTNVLTSVYGRVGAITAQTNDYTWAQINKTVSSIGDIADVNVGGALNGDVLKYDSTTGKWVPSAVTGGAGATGPQGATGPSGVAGTNGSQGIQGLTGPQGIQGIAGVAGTNGLDGASGILVLQAGAAINGVIYPADTTTTLQTSIAPLATNLTDVVNVGFLSNYVSNASLSTTLIGYVTAAGLTTSLTGYATTGTLSTQATTTAANLSTGLATKEPTVNNPNDTTKYYRGDKTWATFTTEAIAALTSTLVGYATTANLATTNTNIANKQDTLNGSSNVTVGGITTTTLNGSTVPDFTTYVTNSTMATYVAANGSSLANIAFTSGTTLQVKGSSSGSYSFPINDSKASMDVAGSAITRTYILANTSAGIDMSKSNSIKVSVQSAAVVSLINIQDGGAYNITIVDSSVLTPSFTLSAAEGATALTLKVQPALNARTAGKDLLINLTRIDSTVYMTWQEF
jgi:hypothetical protein